MLARWKKIRQEFELKNPWWAYRKDIVLLPAGREGEYHYVHVAGSSMVVPLREDGTIIMVRQYRYLLDRDSLEFPCGSMKEGSSHDETAQIELAEETGFRARKLVAVGEHNPYNGVTDEMSRVYIAQDLVPVAAEHDDTEEFEYEYLTPEQLEAKILSGEIWDGMTLASWSIARSRVNEIVSRITDSSR